MINYFKKIFHLEKKEEIYSAENRIKDMFSELNSDIITIKLGNDLSVFSENLSTYIADFREDLFQKSGFILPAIKVINENSLQENEFNCLIRDKNIYSGFCHLNPDDAIKEIINSLETIYLKNIDDIFSNELVEKYIDTVQKQNAWLIWNLTNAMPVWGIKMILVNLLKNKKSIKDISYIFEKICKYATKNRDICMKVDPYIVSEKVFSELS